MPETRKSNEIVNVTVIGPVAELCAEFVACCQHSLKAEGRLPEIEAFLARVSEDDRPVLRRELEAIQHSWPGCAAGDKSGSAPRNLNTAQSAQDATVDLTPDSRPAAGPPLDATAELIP